MQYLQDLLSHPSSPPQTKDNAKDIQFVVIGHGSYKNIDRYAELTGCAKAGVPVYSDEKKQVFKSLGVTNNANGLPDHSPLYARGKGNYTLVWESLVEMATSPWRLIWSGGDFKQLGGEFVFDQGECERDGDRIFKGIHWVLITLHTLLLRQENQSTHIE